VSCHRQPPQCGAGQVDADYGRAVAKPSESGTAGRVSDMCVLPRDVRWFLYRGFLLN
jgi:hypothetical protein